MAENIVKNRKALVIGRGGAGKSHMVKRLRPTFEARGYTVRRIEFTHVAVVYINSAEYPAHTILHLLHSFVGSKTNKQKYALVVDECILVTLSMWSALLNVTFTSHTLAAFGNPDRQFAPAGATFPVHNFAKHRSTRACKAASAFVSRTALDSSSRRLVSCSSLAFA